mmetsp:Transcript_8038/g.25205  ORF Transcript_8038/g.25205 Transcript_8038/m.25205 type:complete len:257 (+) Transcript_8038:930-1700(+)
MRGQESRSRAYRGTLRAVGRRRGGGASCWCGRSPGRVVRARVVTLCARWRRRRVRQPAPSAPADGPRLRQLGREWKAHVVCGCEMWRSQRTQARRLSLGRRQERAEHPRVHARAARRPCRTRRPTRCRAVAAGVVRGPRSRWCPGQVPWLPPARWRWSKLDSNKPDAVAQRARRRRRTKALRVRATRRVRWKRQAHRTELRTRMHPRCPLHPCTARGWGQPRRHPSSAHGACTRMCSDPHRWMCLTFLVARWSSEM